MIRRDAVERLASLMNGTPVEAGAHCASATTENRPRPVFLVGAGFFVRARGGVWFQDIVDACLGTSWTGRCGVGVDVSGHRGRWPSTRCSSKPSPSRDCRIGRSLPGTASPNRSCTSCTVDGSPRATPRSSRSPGVPARARTAPLEIVRDRIVALRDELVADGLDAGADTITEMLAREGVTTSRATVWRVLTAAGRVAPQPQKRPRSSWRRFAADRPNELWQSDFTHVPLSTGTTWR